MKRFAACVVLVVLGMTTAAAVELRVGLSASEGLLYNGQWSAALDAGALAVMLTSDASSDVAWEGGFELASAGLGAQVLVPAGLAYEPKAQGELSWQAAAHALLGATLTKPLPSPLWGAEVEARCLWQPQGVGLGLSVGLRYTQAPVYAATVAPYGVLDLPVRFDVLFGW